MLIQQATRKTLRKLKNKNLGLPCYLVHIFTLTVSCILVINKPLFLLCTFLLISSVLFVSELVNLLDLIVKKLLDLVGVRTLEWYISQSSYPVFIRTEWYCRERAFVATIKELNIEVRQADIVLAVQEVLNRREQVLKALYKEGKPIPKVEPNLPQTQGKHGGIQR
ncbi:hypothetical protein OsccyDRAFT_0545 [Leptolyngbyaceae cyanobacterium JSC-12]|nr:hypothetical protein OsccyDRAFT_0545 [Leptolyngbyaceae cyanobacterium JSC-12]